MKRSKLSTKAMRQRSKTSAPAAGSSVYAMKRRSGRMMYGPGCCAHHLIKRRGDS